MNEDSVILGAGMTGLAAGMVSGLPVIEAAGSSGGICQSYYMAPGSSDVLLDSPPDEEVYRFENGGGHWIFGGDPGVLHFIRRLVDVKHYARRSSVFFPDSETYVPYPIQNNLRYLPSSLAADALGEMANPVGSCVTMEDWMNAYFGKTLTKEFFGPFHALYTAELYREIAPQDPYKSPVNFSMAVRGAFQDAPAVGYNTTFIYPVGGLNRLASKMAEFCDIRYGRCVEKFDIEAREIQFSDGSRQPYESVQSTLPLNTVMQMAGLTVDARPDPHTSVLVLNIGATKGDKCPEDHWLYIPHSRSGFHRVGFYSNVDASFLPASARSSQDRVSIYIERAFQEGHKPTEEDIQQYCQEVTRELIEWGYIREAEVVHPTWIDVAYTWSWPGSTWVTQAVAALEEQGIYQIGRYGRWVFQGIADSIRDGFVSGGCFKPMER